MVGGLTTGDSRGYSSLAHEIIGGGLNAGVYTRGVFSLQSKDARFGAQRRKKTAPTLLCVPDADKAQSDTHADIARTYNVDPATISRLAAPSEALGAPPSGHAPRSNHPRCLFATLARVGNEI